MTWKAPDGTMLATGMVTDDSTTITCGGAPMDVADDANCAWVYEGPNDGDCDDGTCN